MGHLYMTLKELIFKAEEPETRKSRAEFKKTGFPSSQTRQIDRERKITN